MSDSKFVKANEEIAEKVVGTFQKIEDTVVGGYKAVEKAAVDAYTGVEDAFVDRYLTHEGESVEDAKKRLASERADRENTAKATQPTGADGIAQASVEASLNRAKASVEASKKAGKRN